MRLVILVGELFGLWDKGYKPSPSTRSAHSWFVCSERQPSEASAPTVVAGEGRPSKRVVVTSK